MKDLNNYIIEKILINKDTIIDNTDYVSINIPSYIEYNGIKYELGITKVDNKYAAIYKSNKGDILLYTKYSTINALVNNIQKQINLHKDYIIPK